MSVNKVILIGRLGQEPESRAFNDGYTSNKKHMGTVWWESYEVYEND